MSTNAHVSVIPQHGARPAGVPLVQDHSSKRVPDGLPLRVIKPKRVVFQNRLCGTEELPQSLPRGLHAFAAMVNLTQLSQGLLADFL